MDCFHRDNKVGNSYHDNMNHEKYLQSMEEIQKYCVSLVKILQLYPRLSSIVDILYKYNIKWSLLTKRNFRGELLRAYNYWIEEEADATQSSLFSSVGIWTSPSLPFQNFIHGCIDVALAYYSLLYYLLPNKAPSLLEHLNYGYSWSHSERTYFFFGSRAIQLSFS